MATRTRTPRSAPAPAPAPPIDITPVRILTPEELETKRMDIVQSTGTITLAQEIHGLVVTDATSRLTATTLLDRVRDALKTVEGKFEPLITPMRKALDSTYALKREVIQPLEASQTTLKNKVSEFDQLERRKLEEAQQAIRAEQARLEQERQAAEDRERRAQWEKEQAEQALRNAKTREEQRVALAASQEAQRKAMEAAADVQEIAQDSAIVAALPLPIPVVTSGGAGGYGSRRTYTWEVTDPGAFFNAVKAGVVPDTVLKVDDAAMDAYWKGAPGVVAKWPGISVREDTTTVKQGGGRK